MKQNLNYVKTAKTFKIAGNEITITRIRPTEKTKVVRRIERHLAKHAK